MSENTLQEQIDKLDQLIQGGASDVQLNLWEMQKKQLETDLANQAAQEQAHGARVEQTRTAALSAIETLTYNGVTLRQLCESDTGYDMAVKMVDMLITSQAGQSSKLIQGYEERELQLQQQLKQLSDSNTQLQANENALTLATKDAEDKKAAAVTQLEEAQAEIKRLNDKVEEQRAELAVGVIGSMKVIDTEQQKAEMEALAEKIKADKTIYDVVPDQAINPKNYTAKLASTGEEIAFNWTVKNSYIIITDPNEVEQFRTKYAEKYTIPTLETPTISSLDIPGVAVQESFPSAGVEHTVDNNGAAELPDSVPTSATVTREEHEALAARVAALEGRAA